VREFLVSKDDRKFTAQYNLRKDPAVRQHSAGVCRKLEALSGYFGMKAY
jgi:hypothetical protein